MLAGKGCRTVCMCACELRAVLVVVGVNRGLSLLSFGGAKWGRFCFNFAGGKHV